MYYYYSYLVNARNVALLNNDGVIRCLCVIYKQCILKINILFHISFITWLRLSSSKPVALRSSAEGAAALTESPRLK